MIKTGKKDIIVSYIAYFLRLTTNIFLLPIILKKLSSEEYGLWNVFLSVGAFVNLIDMGFGVIIVRYITYAFCGAQDISETGVPKLKGDGTTNYSLLFRIFFAGKRVYGKLFLIAIIIVSFLSIYIMHIINEVDFKKAFFSWIIYGFSICLYIYYISYNCLVKGLGKLKESYIFYIIQQVIYLGIAAVLLSMNWGILAMAVANFIASLVFRFLNICYVRKLFFVENELYQRIKHERRKETEYIYHAIKNNTRGLALVTTSNYISTYGGTVVSSAFLSLEQIASYALTNQIIGIIAAIATVPFSIFMPKLSDLQLNHKMEQVKNYYAGISVFMLVIYLLGGLTLGIAGNWALGLFGTNINLLPVFWVIILLFNSYILSCHQRCTNFIMLSNRQPHIKAYGISSIITLLLTVIGLAITRNIAGYIIPALLVQLAYNAWRWPMELNKQIQMRPFEKWRRLPFFFQRDRK